MTATRVVVGMQPVREAIRVHGAALATAPVARASRAGQLQA